MNLDHATVTAVLANVLGCALGVFVGAFIWRLFPKFKRGTLLLARYSTGDEFMVRYDYRSAAAYHRCRYVGELDDTRSAFHEGESLTFRGGDLRAIPAGGVSR